MDMDAKENDKLENYLREGRDIWFGLAPNTFILVSSCIPKNDIWIRLNDLYSREDN